MSSQCDVDKLHPQIAVNANIDHTPSICYNLCYTSYTLYIIIGHASTIQVALTFYVISVSAIQMALTFYMLSVSAIRVALTFYILSVSAIRVALTCYILRIHIFHQKDVDLYVYG